MRIEFEEKDLSYIDKINEDLGAGKTRPLFIGEKGKRYFIEFTCEDIAKANSFVMMLMNPNSEEANKMRDKFGIRVESINYCSGDSKKEQLKNYLLKMLQELGQV